MLLLAEDPNGSFVLESDIDMSELAPGYSGSGSTGANSPDPNAANWTPIPLSGTLYGACYTIYSLKIDRFGDYTAATVV
jgi:hypothetical protein